MKKKTWRADLVLLLGLAAIGGVIALVLLLTGHTGATVRVKVGSELVKTFALQADTTYTIEGKDGGTNQLVIQGGEAWLEDASCPDLLCVNMGKISRNGQSIVCLPNQVVVDIVDEIAEDDGPDVVAGG